jgi:hypothetical protein
VNWTRLKDSDRRAVAVREHRRQHQLDHPPLADDDFRQLGGQMLAGAVKLLDPLAVAELALGRFSGRHHALARVSVHAPSDRARGDFP